MKETVRKREEIEAKYTWDLSDIFESNEAWEKAFTKVNEIIPDIEKYKGRLSESPGTLKEALDLFQNTSADLMELYPYSKMSKDLNNRDEVYQAMYDRIVSVYFAFATRTAFIEPEISAMDEDLLRSWIQEEELAEYAHQLDNLLRKKKHILPEAQEQLLSGFGPIVDGIGEAFSMLNDVELDFGEVELADGTKVKLTHGSYGSLRESQDRNVRSQTFEKLHRPYEKFGNTISAIYASSVKSDVFYSNTRKFDSSMQGAMFEDNLPESIYTNLIQSIHDSLPAFYKYIDLRKKVLGLDELHIYDTAVPIVGEMDKTYDFEEAKDILRKGLRPLGEKYMEDLNKFIEGRAIDVYETADKTSGAYAFGTYRSHPYMLLNWSGKLDDVFTFAHEAGHCMHSFYSDKNQTYANSHYPIFLAEIASTVNENVLLRYLLEECDTGTKEGLAQKAFLLNHYLDGVKSTVHRQTMFAEFEYKVHLMAESGQPIIPSVLCNLYRELLELYFGENTVIDDYMNWEWARIPHFYRAFYVYKYATGFCAAALIADRIFEEEGAADKYMEFLSAGGSDYPGNILGIMGIDLSQPKAVTATMDLFEKRVKELEDILEELKQ